MLEKLVIFLDSSSAASCHPFFLRHTFYCYQAAKDAGAIEALFEVNRREFNLKNRVEETTEAAVMAFAINFPVYAQARASNELQKQGVFIFTSGVRSMWMRHNFVDSLREFLL